MLSGEYSSFLERARRRTAGAASFLVSGPGRRNIPKPQLRQQVHLQQGLAAKAREPRRESNCRVCGIIGILPGRRFPRILEVTGKQFNLQVRKLSWSSELNFHVGLEGFAPEVEQSTRRWARTGNLFEQDGTTFLETRVWLLKSEVLQVLPQPQLPQLRNI